METQLETYRFSVDEYQRLGEAGILHEDDRIELLDGELIITPPIGSRHSAVVMRLIDLFTDKKKGRYHVNAQNPFTLDDYSQPQPDILVLQPHDDYYQNAHPEPEDIFLVIEVAESSLEYDRETKIPRYARQGVAEAWLVNLIDDVVEVFREPAFGGYQNIQRLDRSGKIAPEAFANVELAVADILLLDRNET